MEESINDHLNRIIIMDDTKVKVRASFKFINEKLKEKLTRDMFSKLEETCFGTWLDVKFPMCDTILLLTMANMQMTCQNPKLGISYNVDGNILTFCPKQFSLITGFKFGNALQPTPSSVGSFRDRLFPDQERIRVNDLYNLFDGDLSRYSLDDVTRMCLLLMVSKCFNGTQSTCFIEKFLVDLVDDLKQWNDYPWGNYFWESCYKNIHNLHLKQQDKAKSFALNGFIWPFKIWIHEVFPEFKKLPGTWSGAKIPRWLSWGPGQKYMKVNVKRIFYNVISKAGYQPLPFIEPSPDELATQFYKSTLGYFEPLVDGQNTDVAVNIDFGGMFSDEEFDPVYDTLNEFPLLDTSDMMPNHKKMKPTVVVDDGAGCSSGQVGMRADLESIVKKYAQSVFVENQKSMMEQVKLELEQSINATISATINAQFDKLFQGLKGTTTVPLAPSAESLTQSKPPEDMSKNVDVDTDKDKEERIEEKVDSTSLTGVIGVEIRRSTRESKPASYLRSPYVIYKNATRKKMTTPVVDESIEDILDWYPTAGSHKIGLCDGHTVSEEFWGRLIGKISSGWLNDNHIMCWITYMYYARDDFSDKWSILPPWFHREVRTKDLEMGKQLVKFYDGSLYPYPCMADVEQVYMPVNVDNAHWFLVAFDLEKKTLTIYNRLPKFMRLRTREIIAELNSVFDYWLKFNGNPHQPVERVKDPYAVVYPEKLPVQDSKSLFT